METIGGATLYQGDCLEIMPTLAAGSIDLVLADLPYGVTACEWDKILPFERLWPEYERLLKPAGSVVLTASQPFTTKLINSKPEWFRYELVWKKNTVTGFLNAKKQPLRNHENVLVFSPAKTGKMVYHPQGLITVDRWKKTSKARIYGRQATGEKKHVAWTNYPRSVLEFNSEVDRHHPSQKPVVLMAYLIQTFSDPGGVVLDNTMGSGSTGVAAL
jgi:site-specific DNA-methyltransferase (adenine-specific)